MYSQMYFQIHRYNLPSLIMLFVCMLSELTIWYWKAHWYALPREDHLWNPAPVDTSATQHLNLRLRDHFRRNIKIVGDRGQGICYEIESPKNVRHTKPHQHDCLSMT